MRLLVATRNPGKRREFAFLLEPLLPAGTEVIDVGSWPTPVSEVVEDGETFSANALKKAIQTCRETGVTCIADDSGLEVDALDGRPGVYSARYAGEHATDAENNARLVHELRSVPRAERTARYVAAVAVCTADDELGRLLRDAVARQPNAVVLDDGVRVACCVRKTSCQGLIVDEPRGDQGFGYDPHFFVEKWGHTMAEVTLEKKNEESHRAKAVAHLITSLMQ